MKSTTLTSLALVTVLVGCGGPDEPTLELFEVSVANGAVSTRSAPGTSLSVATGEPLLECAEDGLAADVTLGFTVTSTAAANAALLTAIIDGGAEMPIGEIPAGGWTHANRIKTAEGAFTVSLPNGEHSLVICATQAGSDGRLSKRACSAPLMVLVDCALQPEERQRCNQGVGNGSEGCDPGNSNHRRPSNDENGGAPGSPGRGGRP